MYYSGTDKTHKVLCNVVPDNIMLDVFWSNCCQMAGGVFFFERKVNIVRNKKKMMVTSTSPFSHTNLEKPLSWRLYHEIKNFY